MAPKLNVYLARRTREERPWDKRKRQTPQKWRRYLKSACSYATASPNPALVWPSRPCALLITRLHLVLSVEISISPSLHPLIRHEGSGRGGEGARRSVEKEQKSDCDILRTCSKMKLNKTPFLGFQSVLVLKRQHAVTGVKNPPLMNLPSVLPCLSPRQ